MLWVLWKVRVEKKSNQLSFLHPHQSAGSTKLLDSRIHYSDFLEAETAVWWAEPLPLCMVREEMHTHFLQEFARKSKTIIARSILPLSLQETSLALSKQDFCHFVSQVPELFSNNVWHLSAYQTNHQGNRQPRRGRRACPGGRRLVEEAKRPWYFRSKRSLRRRQHGSIWDSFIAIEYTNSFKMLTEDWQDGSLGRSVCYIRKRIWVQIPSTQTWLWPCTL